MRIDRSKLKRKLKLSRNYFLSLAGSIIYQQISTKAGNSIYRKFLTLFGKEEPSPKALLSLATDKLRSIGLSGQKCSYLRDLAMKFEDKTIDPKQFSRMSDEKIRKHLIQVRGVGPWTADMFLIFALNRPNVLPLGDLGIVKGFQKAFGLKRPPSEKTMRRLARGYDGEHTYLSLYLWQVIDEGSSGEVW